MAGITSSTKSESFYSFHLFRADLQDLARQDTMSISHKLLWPLSWITTRLIIHQARDAEREFYISNEISKQNTDISAH